MSRAVNIPAAAQLALALVAIVVGMLFILRADSVIAGIRRWLLVQFKWLRRPGYRRMLRFYGWLLLVLGVALALVLLFNRRFS